MPRHLGPGGPSCLGAYGSPWIQNGGGGGGGGGGGVTHMPVTPAISVVLLFNHVINDCIVHVCIVNISNYLVTDYLYYIAAYRGTKNT